MVETLYARDSKGKILEWTIKVIATGMKVDIMKSYGELEGNHTIVYERDIQGKNIGKANETTPKEQALSSLESQVNRKRDKGYRSFIDLGLTAVPSLEELELILPKYRQDASGNAKPMKAQQYYRSKKDWEAPDGTIHDDRKYYYMKNPLVEKEPKSIITKFPCMAQPKINGVRATIKITNNKAVMLSKEGKEYIIPQILDYCNMRTDVIGDLVLDGELYIHTEPLSVISSAVKKVSLNTQRIVFVIFDLALPGLTQRERWVKLKTLSATYFEPDLNCPIQLIRSFNVNTDADAQTITDRFISQGYEGSIFRDYNAEYKFGGRPMTMTKLKRTISHEFSIVNVVPQKKDFTKANFQCLTDNGEYFDVDPKGTDDYKRLIMQNSSDYIGKKITLVFYEWTEDKKPFHIIEAVIRDYE